MPEVYFDVLPNKNGHLGLITLNRPEALNALNPTMVAAIYQQLILWSKASHIKVVVIRSNDSRAFCAGGDLRFTYEKFRNEKSALRAFFLEEYRLNQMIYHYPKPYIAFLDGITMGGGVGISIHGSHRVATERLVFAMPETGIGFFPDIGATYFLPRLPDFLGFYLGLTGAKLDGDGSVLFGIAQHKVASASIPKIIEILSHTVFEENVSEAITAILKSFQLPVHGALIQHYTKDIANCFSAISIEAILEKLKQLSSTFCHETAQQLLLLSPTSLKVTLRALRLGLSLNFDDCMQQEYRIACHFLEGNDFFEGIRSRIIDKDHQPIWQPNQLNDVTESQVENFFRLPH